MIGRGTLGLALAICAGGCAQAPIHSGPAEPGVAFEAAGQFKAEIPAGFHAMEIPLGPPIAAAFARRLWDGEAALAVEHYPAESGVTRETFLRNLRRDAPPAKRSRNWRGRAFEVYEVLAVEDLSARLPPGDPHLETLGAAIEPPRLSLLESRRFHPAGEAYRLYRCRKAGLWGLLRLYDKARLGAAPLTEFRAIHLSPDNRRSLSACFGSAVALAMDRGEEVPAVAKPSMYRLRLMARHEWRTRSIRRVEHQSVHIPDGKSGFYAIRYRAPSHSFRQYYPAYLAFLASFQPS